MTVIAHENTSSAFKFIARFWGVVRKKLKYVLCYMLEVAENATLIWHFYHLHVKSHSNILHKRMQWRTFITRRIEWNIMALIPDDFNKMITKRTIWENKATYYSKFQQKCVLQLHSCIWLTRVHPWKDTINLKKNNTMM